MQRLPGCLLNTSLARTSVGLAARRRGPHAHVSAQRFGSLNVDSNEVRTEVQTHFDKLKCTPQDFCKVLHSVGSEKWGTDLFGLHNLCHIRRCNSSSWTHVTSFE